MNRTITVLMALALIAAARTPASARHGGTVKQALAATGVDADASGQATLSLKAEDDGRFVLQVHKLDPKATFQVIVGGVHVGDIVTTGGGGGKLRFRSRPRGHDLALGPESQLERPLEHEEGVRVRVVDVQLRAFLAGRVAEPRHDQLLELAEDPEGLRRPVGRRLALAGRR